MMEIPLTQGKVALVDDEDYEYLNQWKWYAFRSKNTWYAKRNVPLSHGRQTGVLMHRVVMRATYDVQVDHRDGNGLNNTRSNLRLCNHKENARNIHFQANNTSGYKGVRWHTQRSKWQAFIKVNYRQIHLGLFENPEEAARAYDKAARHHFGDFAHCNYGEIPRPAMNKTSETPPRHLALAKKFIEQYEERINQEQGPKDPDLRRLYEERPYRLCMMHAAYAQADAATRQAVAVESLCEFAGELIGGTDLVNALLQWSYRQKAG